MNQPVVNCPDCALPMEIGCLPELTKGSVALTTFLPGIPPEEKWFGLLKTGGVVVDWKKMIPVTAFRCPKCGLLKSYALPPPVAPTAQAKEPIDDFPPGIDEDRYRLDNA